MYLPHRADGKVMYTGTHDNDTVRGWRNSGAAEHERRNAGSLSWPQQRRYPLGIHPRGRLFSREFQASSPCKIFSVWAAMPA